jgi:hypothetical protein
MMSAAGNASARLSRRYGSFRHQLLFKRKHGFIPRPDLVVIDEGFWNATLHGTDKRNPFEVPLDELLVERLVDKNPIGTDFLRHISRKTHEIAMRATGRLSRRALTDAGGVTAGDFRECYRLEWQRKIEVQDYISPGMPIGKLKKICAKVEAHNKQITRLSRLFKLLIATMEAPDEFSPWIEIVAEPRVGEQGEDLSFHLVWRDEIHEDWRVKTMLLDATPRIEIVRSFYPQVEIKPERRLPTPYAHVRQVSNRSFAASNTTPSEGANDRTNKTRRNNAQRISRFIETRADRVRPRKVVVICQLKLKEALLRGALPDNVEFAHYNSITGLNDWSKVGLLIAIGRTEPGVRDVERIARALFGCTITEVPPDEKGTCRGLGAGAGYVWPTAPKPWSRTAFTQTHTPRRLGGRSARAN